MENEILKRYYWVREPFDDGVGKSYAGMEDWIKNLSSGKRKQILSQFKRPEDIRPVNLKKIYV